MKDEKVVINFENEFMEKKVKKIVEVAEEEKEKIKSYISGMKRENRCMFFFKMVFLFALIGVIVYLVIFGLGYYSASQDTLINSISDLQVQVIDAEEKMEKNQGDMKKSFDDMKSKLQDVQSNMIKIQDKEEGYGIPVSNYTTNWLHPGKLHQHKFWCSFNDFLRLTF